MSGIRQPDLSRNRFRNKFWTRVKRAKGTSKSKEQKRDGKVLEVHQGDCVWPLEGSNVAVFVTDVLLGDDNTVCVLVTCSGILINLRSTLGVKTARLLCRWKRARCSVSCRKSSNSQGA